MWGAISGVAAAAGVFLGGVLSQGPGWRWVLFVNIPVCVLIVVAAFRARRPVSGVAPGAATFDVPRRGPRHRGMLLLVFALVRAPDAGWGNRHTIGRARHRGAVLLVAFVVNERRTRTPLFPFAILRVKGLAAADATQLIAFAGFVSMFFFLTLYMQNVLGYTPIQSGSAYLPVTAGIVVAAGLSAQLIPRIGTRPIIVAGALIAAAGMFFLSRVPVHGSYLTDLLPGLRSCRSDSARCSSPSPPPPTPASPPTRPAWPPVCSTPHCNSDPRSGWPSSPPSPPPAPTISLLDRHARRRFGRALTGRPCRRDVYCAPAAHPCLVRPPVIAARASQHP